MPKPNKSGKKVLLDGQTVDNVNTGSKTIGTAAVAVSANSRTLHWGVQVVATSTNTVSIWVGRKSNMTAGTNDDTDGFELVPGGTIFIPAPTETKVFGVSGTAGQKCSFLSY